MALFVNQNDSRSELQKRLAVELQEKLKTSKPLDYEKPISSVEEGNHESQNLGPVLAIIGGIVVIGIVLFLLTR